MYRHICIYFQKSPAFCKRDQYLFCLSLDFFLSILLIVTAVVTVGLLRLVGFLKMWVSFAKEPFKRARYSAKETFFSQYHTKYTSTCDYGMHTISRVIKNTSLCCKKAMEKNPIFSRQTYFFPSILLNMQLGLTTTNIFVNIYIERVVCVYIIPML